MKMIDNKSRFVKGHSVSDSHKYKLSQIMKGNNYGFKKGHTPWNKNIPCSEGTKLKLSISMKGKNSWNKNKKYSEETKRKISLSKKGSIPWNFGKAGTYSMKHSGQFKKGQKSWNYIDGRSRLLAPARYGDDWDKIRYLVYCRDRFTCQECGIKGVRLDIHHIVPFLISFDNSLNNLITLCRKCHVRIENNIIAQKEVKIRDSFNNN